MRKKYLTKSSVQTKKLGEIFAKEILRRAQSKKAKIIGLEGDLGGGKTTFLQGLAKGLGVRKKILSPTFVIIKRFPVYDPRLRSFYHIDCYRLKKAKEILDLGLREIIRNPQNIVAIEWVDKVKKIMPKRVAWIKFKFIDKKKREITITNAKIKEQNAK